MRSVATTGTVNTSERITHQDASASPRDRAFAPANAALNAQTPLADATASAISPRVRHPRTATGLNATEKKSAGIIAGIAT